MGPINNAEREVVNGNLWRAKEILQGSIPNLGYDRDLFEKLGTVLLLMGDLPEAGRFLFLSGRVNPEYEAAINIFLRKHGKNWRSLFNSFPRVARLTTPAEYPESVGRQLEEFGCPKVLKNDASFSQTDSGGSMSEVVGWVILGSILLVLLLGIIKVVELIRWLI